MSLLKKSRSRLGCMTCRRKKKKCDESLFPICQNCEYSGSLCEWPQTIQNKHSTTKEKASSSQDVTENVPVALDSEIDIHSVDVSHPAGPHILSPEQLVSPPSATEGPQKKASQQLTAIQRRHSHILERIGMQQDCVEDEILGANFALTSVESPVLWASEQELYDQNYNPGPADEFVWPQIFHEILPRDVPK